MKNTGCSLKKKGVYIAGIFLVVVLAVVAYFVFFSGSEVKVDVSDAKQINIVSNDKITQVNEPGKKLIINVDGRGNKVVVSVDSMVSKVIFKGENNYVHLCMKGGTRGMYAVEDTGIKNYVMTLDCPGD